MSGMTYVGRHPGAAPDTAITQAAFLRRFQQGERISIRSLAGSIPAVEDYLALLNVATYVDLDDPDTRAGVEALEAAGAIGPGRAAEILDTSVEDGERQL